MNLRKEMAGAWRSLRYDMGKRPVEPTPFEEDVPDVTYTGMSTFGGAPETSAEVVEPAGRVRPPRRAAAVAAFGALAVAGAAGSYFAVVNGLGALLADEPAAPDPYPLAVGAPDGTTGDDLTANAGMGRGTTTRPAPAGTQAAEPGAVRVPPAKIAQPAARQPAAPGTRPTRPGTPASEDCDCLTPPVPTPTAPGSTPPPSSPSPSPSPSDGASSSSEPPSASPPAEPSGSGSGDPTGRSAHRRRS
jgi:hypothetical protein